MKQNSRGRKRPFPVIFLMAEILIATVSLPAFSAPVPITQSARQQINALVLKHAGSTLDALATQKQWQDYHYQLNVFMPASVASLAACTSQPVITGNPQTDKSLRQMNFDVVCRGASPWQVKATVKPAMYVPVVMPVRQLERGDAIEADDLMLKKFNVSNQHGDLFFRVEDAVGMTARRTLGAMKPFTLTQLEQPLLVKRDEAITIISQSGEITAQTAGVALKNGHRGEVIKVQNANSQRIVSAAVEESGVVKALTATQ